MHFAVRGYLLVALTALLGVAGLWTDDPAFATGWLFPAVLLLGGLAFEAWYARGTHVVLRMHVEGRLKLGRAAPGAFAFRHDRRRPVTLQYARALPAAFRQHAQVREVELPAGEELRDEIELMPLLLGAGRFEPVAARLRGRLSLAWWSRELPRGESFTVAPDSLPRGARPIAGESAGETPRRLPGAGVELLQLRAATR
jgi:uncharacterized protein (DUF58 family)